VAVKMTVICVCCIDEESTTTPVSKKKKKKREFDPNLAIADADYKVR